MPGFFQSLPAILDQNRPFALGIITRIKGSSPQKPGAKALFFADGQIIGTLGGGCLEAEIQDRARRALLTGKPATFELILDHDFGWDDGLICGGKVSGLILPRAHEAHDIWRTLSFGATRAWGVRSDFSISWFNSPDETDWLYREEPAPPVHLWIAGSGHIAHALAPLALATDFQVTIFDDRPTLANRDRFPAEVKLRVGDWSSLVLEKLPEQPVFGVIVTRGHQHDALVLKHWISKPFAFLGMIGSKRKARVIFEQFIEDGIADASALARVASPLGLDLGGNTVNEIAVSIIAQLIAKRSEERDPSRRNLPSPQVFDPLEL